MKLSSINPSQRLLALGLSISIALAVTLGGFVSSAEASSPEPATQAFAQAATAGPEAQGAAQPEAIPAIVGTAVLTGAAAEAGRRAAGWAWDRVAGRWNVAQAEPTVPATIFD